MSFDLSLDPFNPQGRKAHWFVTSTCWKRKVEELANWCNDVHGTWFCRGSGEAGGVISSVCLVGLSLRPGFGTQKGRLHIFAVFAILPPSFLLTSARFWRALVIRVDFPWSGEAWRDI